MAEAIRFLEVRRVKGKIDDFGGFSVDVETEKGLFKVRTDKLHHPEWYGMVNIDFADKSIAYLHEDGVHGYAWTDDERIIAALARLTSDETDFVDVENPTKEDARKVYERLKIPNAPGGADGRHASAYSGEPNTSTGTAGSWTNTTRRWSGSWWTG